MQTQSVAIELGKKIGGMLQEKVEKGAGGRIAFAKLLKIQICCDLQFNLQIASLRTVSDN